MNRRQFYLQRRIRRCLERAEAGANTPAKLAEVRLTMHWQLLAYPPRVAAAIVARPGGAK